MSNNKAEASAQGVSHIESSDSEHLYRDSDSETSESDEDVEEEINIDVEREYPKHFHERGDTLVEFFSSFESAMDKQRLRTIEDDRNSGKTPRMETPLHIEKYAAQVYTLALYYRVREEIRNACFHTTMPEMSRTDEMRYFTCKDDLAKGQLFKMATVSYDRHIKLWSCRDMEKAAEKGMDIQ
ncbi:hypothetical protein ACET3Z_010584 [Daucus carota]